MSTTARFVRSQEGKQTERPLTYTGSPLLLFASDIRLFFRNILYLPFIFLPLYPWLSGPMDELYPSPANLTDIAFHCVLFVAQLGFLTSLPFLIYLPVWLYLLYIATVLGLNALVCLHFNKGIPEGGLKSTEDEYSRQWAPHDDEYWIFLNGICVGRNWLQSNIDRLSRGFHRPVVGVHNTTNGVVFDLVQCLVQRAFLYATSDIRDCYVLVKRAIYRPGIKKVVLILHSQGGIEGGMMLDWLLDEIPQSLLQYLEVYTFGCLANHFSNPSRDTAPKRIHERAISHIEHYANAYDFASRWGVLNFTRVRPENRLENRFMGRVFVNPRPGHQLNQHYLDSIFPLGPTRRFTRDPEKGDFMDMDASVEAENRWIEEDKQVSSLSSSRLTDGLEGESNSGRRNVVPRGGMLRGTPTNNAGIHTRTGTCSNHNFGTPKMWELSRLWQYRNGGRPST
ncbi:Uncharacterized protein TPAR_07558 [Tolypocladium paradoxum]|uniref:Uncharacterized protein n=1 Tax=Tolypocladium paradoxum TaxID=94208 RepID=A0A2S4KPW6_9HYPO|nr:Uncharacterized protein TPAR_07558 [Tolypocladium paradoxum]